MTQSTRNTRKSARRAGLVDAAIAAFMAKGVAGTSVDDIVRAAGVAKGTFYLYFGTKDDVVNAVAERIVESVGDRIEELAAVRDRPAVDRLLGLGEALGEVGGGASQRELIETLHRPENQAIHDRMSERVLVRLQPTLAGIIADGVAEGAFDVPDARHAAWFVLSTLGSLHHLVRDPSELAAATAELDAFILRGLGHAGAGRRP